MRSCSWPVPVRNVTVRRGHVVRVRRSGGVRYIARVIVGGGRKRQVGTFAAEDEARAAVARAVLASCPCGQAIVDDPTSPYCYAHRKVGSGVAGNGHRPTEGWQESTFDPATADSPMLRRMPERCMACGAVIARPHAPSGGRVAPVLRASVREPVVGGRGAAAPGASVVGERETMARGTDPTALHTELRPPRGFGRGRTTAMDSQVPRRAHGAQGSPWLCHAAGGGQKRGGQKRPQEPVPRMDA